MNHSKQYTEAINAFLLVKAMLWCATCFQYSDVYLGRNYHISISFPIYSTVEIT